MHVQLTKNIAPTKAQFIALAGVLPVVTGVAAGSLANSFTMIPAILVMLAIVAWLPRYVKLCNQVEDGINLRTAMITPARIVRLFYPLPLIAISLYLLRPGPVVNLLVVPATITLLCAAAAVHCLAADMAYRGHGDWNTNTVAAFAMGFWLASAAIAINDAPTVFAVLTVIYVYYLVIGLLSDLRSRFYPKRGIGIFFGTFNPIHKTHVWIIGKAIRDRGLSKVYIHPTTVPKLHRDAIRNGELLIRHEDGMRVYELSGKADPGKNYFPTGNRFYEYDIRRELIRTALSDAGLADKAELLEMPDVYEARGFSGVVKEIKRLNPGVPVHGLHGSDVGGMWVRNIFDNSGWLYPCPIVRSNHISATAIRAGAVGFTTETVERFLQATRAGKAFVFPNGYFFPAGGGGARAGLDTERLSAR